MFFNWKKHLSAFAVMAAIVTLGSVAVPKKVWIQVKATFVKDVENPARGAFAAIVDLDYAGTQGKVVSIPAGYRLVVDYVNVAGAAPPTGTQIFVQLSTNLSSGGSGVYSLMPVQSALSTDHFVSSNPVTLYADNLYVSLAYSGSAPAYGIMKACVSGHLDSQT